MPVDFIKPLDQLRIEDVPLVGGKNASLGEMIHALASQGVDVPGGYAITAPAYTFFLAQTDLLAFITDVLNGLDTKNLQDLSIRASAIRTKITQTEFPQELTQAITAAHQLAETTYGSQATFAVRSSATAEDLPDASFAGEHESYLHVSGIADILVATRRAYASLFTDRAISYRVDKGFDHFKVALSVGVQKMVRSDLACSGVMFSLDSETGFPDVVLINGSWGLGEMIVQGAVSPDEFLVFKKTLESHRPIIDKKLGAKAKQMIYGTTQPTTIIDTPAVQQTSFVLTDDEILKLAHWATAVEKHYSSKHGKWTPMDMEWAKDGQDGKLYMIQARPETVHSARNFSIFKEYVLSQQGQQIVTGVSVGSKIATGIARIILDPKDIGQFVAGEILVTDITDPDWEPIMKIASAIITDKGGRTSHAAIVSRELGIPAIVGCGNATTAITTGQELTVDCSGETGIVYQGLLKFTVTTHDITTIPQTKTHVMLNIATPQTAFEKSFLPSAGVGLAREEFIIAGDIGIHPLALINFASLPSALQNQITTKTQGYLDKQQFYVDKLAYGIAKISAAFYPKPVIVRFSDFKTNEYRSLLGGDLYEPQEENPMLGWRGASRYYSSDFAPAFILEIEALKKVIAEFGLTNTCIMIPFCRTVAEGQKVIKIMADNDLSRQKFPQLHIYVMCEIPANVLLAEQFLEIFDGMSIGSNDLTQLALGLDRDGNAKIKNIANENDESVKLLVQQVITVCKKKHKYIGICGQAPSDFPGFVEFLIKAGIDSISLNPDALIQTTLAIHQYENS